MSFISISEFSGHRRILFLTYDFLRLSSASNPSLSYDTARGSLQTEPFCAKLKYLTFLIRVTFLATVEPRGPLSRER